MGRRERGTEFGRLASLEIRTGRPAWVRAGFNTDWDAIPEIGARTGIEELS